MLCGDPPHFRHSFPKFFNKVFPEEWLRRGGPTACPARCPDLNPLGGGEGNCSLLFMLQNSVTSVTSNTLPIGWSFN